MVVWLCGAAETASETGVASFYGTAHEGKRMANGKPFRAEALTAASRSIPLGKRVRVCRIPPIQPIRCVRVTITDRGPFVRGRIIDLSFAAARDLGFLTRGLARVTVTQEQSR
jgi:rare lipoprotein A